MFSLIKQKWACLLTGYLLCSLFVLQGCPLAIVAIVAAYSNDGADITVTVEIPRSADRVFEAAVLRTKKGISETGVPYKVTAINEEKYTISIEGTDGSWRGDFIVVPINSNESQIIAHGSDDVRSRAESENLILLGIENLCKDLGVRYDVIKRNMD
ncbi:hypothetical protein D0S45_00785 [Marinifilum sp. JC120]|nr:hypothetical protein D0S45_00785 [Marinifilum sp. JC120]